MNECVLVGKVREVPEVKTTPKGTVMASLVLDCERNFRDEDGTIGVDTFNVTVWRGAAEQAASTLRPGHMIAVRGRLSGRYVQKEDRNYFFTEVVGESIEYLRTLS